MRATGIRKQDKSKLTQSEMTELACVLRRKLEAAGFITRVEPVTPKRKAKELDPNDVRAIVRAIRNQDKPKRVRQPTMQLRIGLHMKCFVINTEMLGCNARVGGYSASRCVSGYVRTNLPTWEQREDFNHIVNDVFDAMKLTATITSGPYSIRTQSGRVDSWYPTGNGFHLGGGNGEILPEESARDCCDSDRREAEAKVKRNQLAREQSKARREKLREIQNARLIRIESLEWDRHAGKCVSKVVEVKPSVYLDTIAGMSRRERSRLKITVIN